MGSEASDFVVVPPKHFDLTVSKIEQSPADIRRRISVIASLLLATANFDRVSIDQKADPLTDKSSYFLAVSTKDSYIAVGCFEQDSKQLEVIVKFDDYLGDQTAGVFAGGMPVTYRFDKKEPQESRWSAEKDRGFASYSIDFAKSMVGTSYLYIKATDYAGYPVTAKFSYSITTEMFGTMFEKCGFNPDGSKRKKAKSKKK